MAEVSAGLLMFRLYQESVQFFLVHPGGPFFRKKNEGAWTIPKGLAETSETLLDTACREFREETGLTARGPYFDLGTTKLKSGKVIHAWAFRGEWDPLEGIKSNTFILEWPPKSGKFQNIAEADRAEWLNIKEASCLINPAQLVFLERAMSLPEISNQK